MIKVNITLQMISYGIDCCDTLIYQYINYNSRQVFAEKSEENTQVVLMSTFYCFFKNINNWSMQNGQLKRAKFYQASGDRGTTPGLFYCKIDFFLRRQMALLDKNGRFILTCLS